MPMATSPSNVSHELRKHTNVYTIDSRGRKSTHSRTSFELLGNTWVWARVPRRWLASSHGINVLSRRGGRRHDWVLIPIRDAQRYHFSYTPPKRLIRARNERIDHHQLLEEMLPRAFYDDLNVREHTNSMIVGSEAYIVVSAGWEYYCWDLICERE